MMASPQHHPDFVTLAEAYRKLMKASLTINDNFRREVDHAVFTGSTDQVDDLREAVNEHLHDWHGFLYPRPRQRY